MMAARCRALDWSTTPLGPVDRWSQSLRTIVSSVLECRHPMFLWWGPELIQIFNDGYLPSFGEDGRDHHALGARGRVFWSEIWSIIGPEVEQVLAGGGATWHEDQLVPIERNGRLEDVWWTYSYSPVRDDDDRIAGVLVTVQETTAAVTARESMARVFAQAPVAIAVMTGREHRFTIANAKYQHLVGGRDPVGKTLTGMFPDLVGSQIEQIVDRVYDTGTPFAASDFLVRFDSRGEGEVDNY